MARKKVERPELVKVGGHEYRIRKHDAWTDAQADTLGSVVFNRMEILLDNSPDISESRKEETLWHEIWEIINYQYELGWAHPVITLVSEASYQVLRDNDGFWRKKRVQG